VVVGAFLGLVDERMRMGAWAAADMASKAIRLLEVLVAHLKEVRDYFSVVEACQEDRHPEEIRETKPSTEPRRREATFWAAAD
jgi:hypothetical protein